MAILPIVDGEGGADVRAKLNAAIDQANLVAGKASATALSAEATARADGDDAEAAARAEAVATAREDAAAALSEEAQARALADQNEAAARAAGDASVAIAATVTALVEYARIGEPGRFATAAITGAPADVVPIPDADRRVSANGSVLAVGAGIVATVAVFRIEPGKHYRLRFVVQRATDTLDPANDAVRLAISWLKADKSGLVSTILEDLVDITVASGRLERPFTVARTDGDTVDVVAPAGAVYCRPYVRCYGSGITHVEVIEWTDLTAGIDWSPDVSEFRNELAGLAQVSTDLLDRMEVVEGGLEQSHDAGWIESGTLDDARLSSNVMLLDGDQVVTGDFVFELPLRLRSTLYVGDDEATGGNASGRIVGAGDRFALAPTDQAGDFRIDRELYFDQAANVWTVEGGLKSGGALTVAGSGAVSGTLAVTGAVSALAGLSVAGVAALSSATFTDAAATRTSLDVYNKAYVDALIAAADAMVFKGVVDCSANPNYPAASAGWTYRVSVAGKIGGASGRVVEAGDLLLCLVDATASGDQATVGANWNISQTNIDGAVVGPASATDATPAVFDGTSGKLIKNITFAAFKSGLVLVKGDVGLGNVDNTSDANKPVSTAQQDALNLKFDKTGGSVSGAVALNVTGAASPLRFGNTSASANQKYWDLALNADGSILSFRVLSDDLASSAGVFDVSRSGVGAGGFFLKCTLFAGADAVYNCGDASLRWLTNYVVNLDASGSLITRAAGLTLANGLNSDIALAAGALQRITGPSGAFSIGGMTGGINGRRLTLHNTTAQTMTIVNEDASSTAANRITTLSGANIVLRASAPSCATLFYDATASRWIVESYN
ncbi:hypothetical protein [Azorhizobium sp. AG788]|uniref:hypothetical protein n=1 Tax=Azorhizobium sp. AG788 TaxID=2183897 RepID=UPI003139D72F